MNRLDYIVQILLSRGADMCHEYGEPGYTCESGILLFDWNDVSQDIQNYLEEKGYSLEWSDEWTIVDNKAYRIQADNYHWQSSIMLTDEGEYLTPFCDIDHWINECLVTDYLQPVKSLYSWHKQEDIEKEGFTLLSDEYENGFHPGQNDDPQKIAEKLLLQYEEVLFQLSEVSQFYCKFKVYVRGER